MLLQTYSLVMRYSNKVAIKKSYMGQQSSLLTLSLAYQSTAFDVLIQFIYYTRFFNLIRMANLEQDLIHSQRQIIGLLTEYQKVSEDIIKSNYTNELHQLLDSIASFNQERIKECEKNFKDEAAIKYLQSIAANIRSHQQGVSREEGKDVGKIECQKIQETKQTSKVTQKKSNQHKKGGIFDFMLNKFGNKQKKATQMILPDEEPKCYFDPVTRTWIFEGEEPIAPKVIAKPPTAAEKKDKEEFKRQKSDDSELSQLTAPPAFKRRSTTGSNAKGKVKIKEETQIVKIIDEPLTFSKMVDKINQNYKGLLEKVREGIYEPHMQIQSSSNAQSLTQYANFAEKTLQFSEQISHYQNKVIQKWSKILASENRELKIMEKVVKELNESAYTYSSALQRIESKADRSKPEFSIKQEVVGKEISKEKCVINQNQQCQTQQIFNDNYEKDEAYILQLTLKIDSLSEQKSTLTQQVIGWEAKFNKIVSSKEEREKMISTLTHQNEIVNKQLIKLENESQQFLSQIHQSEELLKQLESDHQLKLYQLSDSIRQNFILQIKSYQIQISELLNSTKQLSLQNNQLQQQLKTQKFKINNGIDKINSELSTEKIKIQTQLKFYEEKQRNYLSSLKNLQEHENIIEEYESSLRNESHLLHTILEKRLQVNKNPEEGLLIANKYQSESGKSIVLQFSDIISFITTTHLDWLQNFTRSYSKLHNKYIQSKELLNKIRNNAASQSMSLNRSVTKLKSLIETYKSGKQQAEERCSNLELDCDRLKKKLQHYRQEDHFNKSYLTKLKKSKLNSQNESVLILQEDKDQLASQIGDLQKELEQKDQALKKTQDDFEDLFINYENSQSKLLELERKYKQNEKEVKSNKHAHEQLKNKIKLLQLKLQNQKERYDQIKIREQNNLKKSESSFDKKLKLFKNELQQSYERQQHLKSSIQQAEKEFNNRINLLQSNYASIENEMYRAIKQKENQKNELFLLLKQANQKLDIQRQQREDILERNKLLMESQTSLNLKLNDVTNQQMKQISKYQESQQSLNNVIATLIQRYSSFKLEQESFKSQYDEKLYHLKDELLSSHNQSTYLVAQLHQYSQYIQGLNLHIEEIKESQDQEKKFNQSQLKQAQTENQELKTLIVSLNAQLNEKLKQNSEFEELIQKMSDDVSRLTTDREQLSRGKTDLSQKLMFKERQLQTLQNQINAKSQELMVKTEELLEKDRIMLEQEEVSVMNKQEFDQLKNQHEKVKRELQGKTCLVEQLQSEISTMKKILLEKDLELERLKSEVDKLNQTVSTNIDQLQQRKAEIDNFTKEIALQQTHLSVMQSKLSVKQSEMQSLLEKIELMKQQTIQIDENDEVEGEMSYLLREIEQRENELQLTKDIVKEKEVIIEQAMKSKYELQCLFEQIDNKVQLKQALLNEAQIIFKNSNVKLSHLSVQKSELLSRNQNLMDQIKLIQLEKLSLQNQKYVLETVKRDQAETIQILEKQLKYYVEAQKTIGKSVQSELNEQKQVVNDLIADVRQKDELIIEKQRQIEGKEETIRQLEQSLQFKQEQLREISKTLGEKSCLLVEMKASQLQKLNKIDQLQKFISMKEEQLVELQKQLTQSGQTIQRQYNNIQSVKNQSLAQIESNELNLLRDCLRGKDNQISEMKNKMNDLVQEYNAKQENHLKIIDDLEKSVANLNLLNDRNKELEENYKTLLDENTTLIDEKVQLMKSNDYLVAMNQKLVGGKNFHSVRQVHKTQSQIIPSSNEKTGQKVETKAIQINSKEQSKGFFGALSSLFLTPTETDRLRK